LLGKPIDDPAAWQKSVEDVLKLIVNMDALHGVDGAVLFTGSIITVYTVAAGYVDVDKVPWLQRVVEAIKDGIDAALSTGESAGLKYGKAQKKCVIPPRR
jgi:hypothetical protein